MDSMTVVKKTTKKKLGNTTTSKRAPQSFRNYIDD